MNDQLMPNCVIGEVVARTKIVGGGSKKKYRSRSTSASSQDSFSSGSYSGINKEDLIIVYFGRLIF